MLHTRATTACPCIITCQGDLLPDTAPWFGRTVIRSCAKMDYGTAQNVIEGLLTPEGVAEGAVGACGSLSAVVVSCYEVWRSVASPVSCLLDHCHIGLVRGRVLRAAPADPELWPEERRPDAASGHTMADVARDIQCVMLQERHSAVGSQPHSSVVLARTLLPRRYMHAIAKARRAKRYSSGAVSLNNPQLYVERNDEGYPVVRAHATVGSLLVHAPRSRLVHAGTFLPQPRPPPLPSHSPVRRT